SRDVALKVILGTEKGMEALTEFLKASGAFKKIGNPRLAREAPCFEDEPDPLTRWDSDDEDEG
ncbi:hypothetical protein FISHEDRAFT_40960, partial [Fistulina hepatica ATCC 64428]